MADHDEEAEGMNQLALSVEAVFIG